MGVYLSLTLFEKPNWCTDDDDFDFKCHITANGEEISVP